MQGLQISGSRVLKFIFGHPGGSRNDQSLIQETQIPFPKPQI